MRRGYESSALSLLGLGVALPIYLAPGSTSSPRLGDAALAAALPLILLLWGRITPVLRAVGPAAAAFLTITLAYQTSQAGDRLNAGDVAFWFRWIAASLVAPAAAHLILTDGKRRRLFFGAILLGALFHLATYGLAFLIGLEPLQAIGLASPRAALTTTGGQVRMTTLAEHPNAAMAMIGLAVPAGAILTGLVAAAAGSAAAILGFVSTLSRGGMAAALLAAAAAKVLVRRRRRDRAALFWGLLMVLGLATIMVASEVGWLGLNVGRFDGRFDPAALETNLAGRAATWRRTVELIIALPVGAGWSSADEMGAFRAMSVSHNGYLFMGRTVGAPAALMMLWLHLRSAARFDALTPLSLYLLATLFSEDQTQGAGFVFLSCLTAALAWRRRTRA